jgi:hypothetical protein
LSYLIATDRIDRRFHDKYDFIIQLRDAMKGEFPVLHFRNDLKPMIQSNNLIVVGRNNESVIYPRHSYTTGDVQLLQRIMFKIM